MEMKMINSLSNAFTKGHAHPWNEIEERTSSIEFFKKDEGEAAVVDNIRTTIPSKYPKSGTHNLKPPKWPSSVFLLLIIGTLLSFVSYLNFYDGFSTVKTTFVDWNKKWMQNEEITPKNDHDTWNLLLQPTIVVDGTQQQQQQLLSSKMKVTTIEKEVESNHHVEESWNTGMNIVIENETTPKRRSLQTSVTTWLQLITAVSTANVKSSGTSTNIIIMNDINVPILSSVDLTNRNIIFTCGKSSPSTNRCILDGQGLTRMFYGTNADIDFQNIHFRNGFDAVTGGAITISINAILTFTNCTFSKNSVLTNGGALTISNNSTVILQQYCYFTQNSAVLNGGAIYLQQASNLIIAGNSGNYNDTIFDSNTATEGAAIYLDNLLSLTTPMTMNISNTLFSNNSALTRGGVFSTSLTGPKTIQFNQVRMDSNTALLEGGGFVASAADVKIVGSNLIRNQMIAQELYVFSCQLCNSFIVQDTIIRNNTGVVNIGLTPQLSMDSTLFDQNIGRPFMLSIVTCTDVTLQNVSFYNNKAASNISTAVVQLLSATSKATLQNMIFVNNTAANTLRFALSNATLTNLSFINNVEPIEFLPLNLPGFGGGNGGAQFGTLISLIGGIDINNVTFSRTPNSNETYCDVFLFAPTYPVSCLNLPDVSTIQPSPLGRRNLLAETQESTANSNGNMFEKEQMHSSTNMTETTKRRRRAQATAKCVQSGTQLQNAAARAKRIPICTQRMRLGSTARRLVQVGNETRLLQGTQGNGIDLSNKKIIIYCRLRRGQQCILDGEGLTRIFQGSNATITFRNLKFANGYHPVTGGALLLTNGSKVSMTNCSFSNNSAPSGGTLTLNNTEIVVNGGGGDNNRSALITSKGGGAPFQMFSSKASLRNMYFAANRLSQYGGTIHVFNTGLELFKVKFSNTSTSRRRRLQSQSECNVFAIFNTNNPPQQASCTNFE